MPLRIAREERRLAHVILPHFLPLPSARRRSCVAVRTKPGHQTSAYVWPCIYQTPYCASSYYDQMTRSAHARNRPPTHNYFTRMCTRKTGVQKKMYRETGPSTVPRVFLILLMIENGGNNVASYLKRVSR